MASATRRREARRRGEAKKGTTVVGNYYTGRWYVTNECVNSLPRKRKAKCRTTISKKPLRNYSSKNIVQRLALVAKDVFVLGLLGALRRSRALDDLLQYVDNFLKRFSLLGFTVVDFDLFGSVLRRLAERFALHREGVDLVRRQNREHRALVGMQLVVDRVRRLDVRG